MGRFKNFINGNVFVDARVYVLVNIMWIALYFEMNHGWSKLCNSINDDWYRTCTNNVHELKRTWESIKEIAFKSNLTPTEEDVIKNIIAETDKKMAGI